MQTQPLLPPWPSLPATAGITGFQHEHRLPWAAMIRMLSCGDYCSPAPPTCMQLAAGKRFKDHNCEQESAQCTAAPSDLGRQTVFRPDGHRRLSFFHGGKRTPILNRQGQVITDRFLRSVVRFARTRCYLYLASHCTGRPRVYGDPATPTSQGLQPQAVPFVAAVYYLAPMNTSVINLPLLRLITRKQGGEGSGQVDCDTSSSSSLPLRRRFSRYRPSCVVTFRVEQFSRSSRRRFRPPAYLENRRCATTCKYLRQSNSVVALFWFLSRTLSHFSPTVDSNRSMKLNMHVHAFVVGILVLATSAAPLFEPPHRNDQWPISALVHFEVPHRASTRAASRPHKRSLVSWISGMMGHMPASYDESDTSEGSSSDSRSDLSSDSRSDLSSDSSSYSGSSSDSESASETDSPSASPSWSRWNDDDGEYVHSTSSSPNSNADSQSWSTSSSPVLDTDSDALSDASSLPGSSLPHSPGSFPFSRPGSSPPSSPRPASLNLLGTSPPSLPGRGSGGVYERAPPPSGDIVKAVETPVDDATVDEWRRTLLSWDYQWYKLFRKTPEELWGMVMKGPPAIFGKSGYKALAKDLP